MDDLATELIAKEREALDAWIQGDTETFGRLFAPEFTYFDTYNERRVDDPATFRSHLSNLGAGIRKMLADRGLTRMDDHQMLNPKLEQAGDMAVLSYDWEARMGPELARWRATDVYRRGPGGWRIVHAHWSLVQPRPAA